MSENYNFISTENKFHSARLNEPVTQAASNSRAKIDQFRLRVLTFFLGFAYLISLSEKIMISHTFFDLFSVANV